MNAIGGMAVGKRAEGLGQPVMRIAAAQLTVFDERGMTAQLSPPSAEPAKSAFFRFTAKGRIDRWTVMVSVSMRPSSMTLMMPAERLVARQIASANFLLELSPRGPAP